MSRVGALALLAVLGLAAPARGESRPAYGDTVVGGLLGAPATLDPVAARSHAELSVVELLFDPLYRVDGDRVVPAIAAALPEVDDDPRLARVPLRTGVLFHDGRPVTAADVAASLERARRAGTPGLEPVVSVRADRDAVVLRLRRPLPDLAARLAVAAASITRSGRAVSGSTAVGTGPFRLARLDRRRRLVRLDAHELHFAGRPYVDRLELRWYPGEGGEARAYETGASHVSLRGAVAFAGHQPKHPTEIAEGPATILVYVGFGRRTPQVTGSRAFRRALSRALGREGLRHLGNGERIVPTLSPAAQALGGPRPPRRLLAPQIAVARRALREAARSVPALAKPGDLDLRILVDESRHDDRDVAGKVAAALFRLGVRAVVEEVPAGDLPRQLAAGKGDLYIGHLAAPSADPAAQIAAAFAAGGDAVPAPAALEARFAERLPVVPLFHRSVRVHHRATLRGLGFTVGARLGLADVFFHPAPVDARR